MKLLKVSAVVLSLILAFGGCGKANDKKTDADTSVSTESTEVSTEAEKDKIVSVTPIEGTDKVSVKKSTSVKKAEEAPAKQEEKKEEKQEEKKEETPEHTMYYWCMETEKDNLNITYHEKDCPLIKDENPKEVGKEVIKMIGLNRCEECNPPEFK